MKQDSANLCSTGENRATQLPATRFVLLFFSAYLVNAILHELSHALTAYMLGVQSTLFQSYVNVDRVHASAAQRAWIGVAGPLFSLLVGSASWLAYKRATGTARELPLLYFATFGISMFLGNLISASFVGDFRSAAVALNVPMAIRYAVTFAGGVSLCFLMYRIGKELVCWAPSNVDRVQAVGALVAIPAIVGTMLVVIACLPLPGNFVAGMLMSSVFWVFAAYGVFANANRPREVRQSMAILWSDGVLAIVAVMIIRAMAQGIPFTP